MQYLTVSQGAEYVGVHVGHVRKACAARRLPGAHRRGKSWRIPEESLAIWFLLPRPVGRPSKPIPVIPPDMGPEALAELIAKEAARLEWDKRGMVPSDTLRRRSAALDRDGAPGSVIVGLHARDTGIYDEWWEIVQQNAPRLASRLSVFESPVLTDAQLRHAARSGLPLEAADYAKKGGRNRRGFKRHKNLRDTVSFGNLGEGSSRLSNQAIRALPSEIREPRAMYNDWIAPINQFSV